MSKCAWSDSLIRTMKSSLPRATRLDCLKKQPRRFAAKKCYSKSGLSLKARASWPLTWRIWTRNSWVARISASEREILQSICRMLPRICLLLSKMRKSITLTSKLASVSPIMSILSKLSIPLQGCRREEIVMDLRLSRSRTNQNSNTT